MRESEARGTRLKRREEVAEFTGERLIPGEVDADLLNEHLARYTFAARLSRGKRVLDIACGAGYGSAELSRVAWRVTGLDVAPEAVGFARTHYQSPNLAFEQASAAALPHRDGCFDLVVGFEVIEHLNDWRAFLNEVRRVMAPGGQFIVSTPNRLYYTESRGASGANPFHVHEFTFEEFRAELHAVFPQVSLFLENHVEGVSFQPFEAGNTFEVRVEEGVPAPDESHFFVAVCAHRPQIGNPTFVYIPRTANVLRERERHIGLLEQEVAQKTEWLARLESEHEGLVDEHRAQTAELEKSNAWAETLNQNVAGLQADVAREQEHSRQVTEGYEAKVRDLDEDLRVKIEWARDAEKRLTAETAELARAVDALHATEKELEERTAWALRLEEEARKLGDQLMMVRASRWMKLGRKIGLGPELPGN